MTQTKSGVVAWRSPSNIAVIKYWGKRHEQLPMNPSLSLTLSKAFTKTQVEYEPSGSGLGVRFYFEGHENEAFGNRVKRYVDRLSREMPVLKNLKFTIRSSNSFPHSAGIASSASAMSALALCLCSIDEDGAPPEGEKFYTKASRMARLGSGSASRSVLGPLALWGKTPEVNGSSDDHAIVINHAAPVFATYCDSILIVDREEKKVKSSAGHALMENHPYAHERFHRAGSHLKQLLDAIRIGDLDVFGSIAESEALDLHAMMMTSSPAYLLIRPNTVRVIELLYNFRQSTGLPVYFTLDAGPNVHLLYPGEHADRVKTWIEQELKGLCHEGQVIHDEVSTGPVRLI